MRNFNQLKAFRYSLYFEVENERNKYKNFFYNMEFKKLI